MWGFLILWEGRRRRNTLNFFPLRRFYPLAFFAPSQLDTLPLFSIPASRLNSLLPPPTFENWPQWDILMFNTVNQSIGGENWKSSSRSAIGWFSNLTGLQHCPESLLNIHYWAHDQCFLFSWSRVRLDHLYF